MPDTGPHRAPAPAQGHAGGLRPGPGHAAFCGAAASHTAHRHRRGTPDPEGYEVCDGVPDPATPPVPEPGGDPALRAVLAGHVPQVDEDGEWSCSCGWGPVDDADGTGWKVHHDDAALEAASSDAHSRIAAGRAARVAAALGVSTSDLANALLRAGITVTGVHPKDDHDH